MWLISFVSSFSSHLQIKKQSDSSYFVSNNCIFRQCVNVVTRDAILVVLLIAFLPEYTSISVKFEVNLISTAQFGPCIYYSLDTYFDAKRNTRPVLFLKGLFCILFSMDTAINPNEPRCNIIWLCSSIVLISNVVFYCTLMCLWVRIRVKIPLWFSRNTFLPISLFAKAYSRPVMTCSLGNFISRSLSVSNFVVEQQVAVFIFE